MILIDHTATGCAMQGVDQIVLSCPAGNQLPLSGMALSVYNGSDKKLRIIFRDVAGHIMDIKAVLERGTWGTPGVASVDSVEVKELP